MICRGCGQMRCADAREGSARLELDRLPLPIVHSRCYLTGTAATVLAFFDWLGIEGRVRLEGPCAPREQPPSISAGRRAGYRDTRGDVRSNAIWRILPRHGVARGEAS